MTLSGGSVVDSRNVWDRNCGHQTRSNSAREAVNNNFTFAGRGIERMVDNYHQVKSCSEEYSTEKADEASG
jgi:hypothetical protein